MRIILLLLAAVLLLGCTGGEQKPEEQTKPIIEIPTVEGPAEECTPDYSFSDLDDGVFSKDSSLVATVTCAGGKDLTLSIDGKVVQTTTIESNATTPVDFKVVGIQEGSHTVSVELDGEKIHSRDWDVDLLGHQDTLGANYDYVSYKEWLAIQMDIENSVEVGQVRIFMKRQNPKTLPTTSIVVQIAKDASGLPGAVVAEKKVPIADTTLSENWIRINLDEKAKLKPGKYWVVMKIEQTEELALTSDIITVHYTPIDKDKPGNDYTRKMRLDADPKTGEATETSWEPLPYDRIHNIVLAYGE